jgi:hypothetical protein
MARNSSGAFKCGSGSGATVTFAGSAAQFFSDVTNYFTGTNALNNLEISNASGLTLNGPVDVNGNLLLTTGNITTSSSNILTIKNTAINSVTSGGGSSTSFVNGPLTKNINQSDYFIYPIGQGSTFGHQFELSSTETGTQLWTAQYNKPNNTSASMNPPLTAVNTQEYWTVTSTSNNQAIVNINWSPTSDITPLMTQNGLPDMRVADYNADPANRQQ